MTHVAAEQLAGRALGESQPTSPAADQHLIVCDQCRATVDELTAVLTVSIDPTSPHYAAPVDPQIWLAIKSRLGLVDQLPARSSTGPVPAGSTRDR